MSEAELQTEPASESRRRWAIIGGAALVLVILLALLIPRLGSQGPPEIRFVPVDAGEGPRGQLAAGPGGFLRAIESSAPGHTGLDWSADGEEWTPVTPPVENTTGWERSTVSGDIEASQDWWLLEDVRNNRRAVWVSPDGEEWTRHVLDGDFADATTRLESTQHGFLAYRNSGNHRFWSNDGITWTEVPNPFEGAVDQPRPPAVSWAGATFIVDDFGAGIARLAHTDDGVEWSRSRLRYGAAGVAPLNIVTGVEEVDGSWMAVSVSWEPKGDDGELVPHLWSAADGVTWELVAAPPAMQKDAMFATPLHLGDVVIFPRVVEGSGTPDAISEWWATRDGITWDSVGEPTTLTAIPRGIDVDRPGGFNGRVPVIAGRQLDDGSHVVVFLADAPADS